MNVVDEFLRHAAALPEKVAVRGPTRSATYGELARRAGGVASALVQRGLARGDVVAIQCEGIDFIACALGVAWAGGACVVLPANGAPDVAELCRVKFTIDRDSVAAFASAESSVPVADCAATDLWRIGFSSGTTGEPKAMTFTHGDTIAKSSLLSGIAGIQGGCTLIGIAATLTFAVAYWMRELARGAAVILAVGPAALDAMETFAVDLVVASPGNALRLVQAAKSRAGGMPRIGTLMLGGAAVSPAQRRLLRSQFCDNLHVNYGATEVGMVALLGPSLMDARPDCAGRLMPWVEAQVNEEGLLRFRSPMMASGYLLSATAPEWDRHAFDGGWFQSRDRGRIGEDGLVYLEAREDLLNIGGNKVEPSSIEGVIAEMPGVLECAVLMIDAQDGAQILVAAVAMEGEIDKAALRAHCKARLDSWKRPQGFVQVAELPRNEAGKVMRSQLAAKMLARRRT